MYNLNGKRRYKLGRMMMVDDAEEILANTIPFESPLPQKLTDEDVISALRAVPENFRQVVVLSDIEEFSYKEISAILRIPIGTVMSRLWRGRKILRMELAEYARRCGFGETPKIAAVTR
jgi:RNA polymerase sigma-70 factor (ECF subfamily)